MRRKAADREKGQHSQPLEKTGILLPLLNPSVRFKYCSTTMAILRVGNNSPATGDAIN